MHIWLDVERGEICNLLVYAYQYKNLHLLLHYEFFFFNLNKFHYAKSIIFNLLQFSVEQKILFEKLVNNSLNKKRGERNFQLSSKFANLMRKTIKKFLSLVFFELLVA